MTAGNATVAFRPEASYREPDEAGNWSTPGRNITITELNLDNQLEELRDPSNPVPVEQLEGNFEGALGINCTLQGDPLPPWADLVLDGGSLPTSGGSAPSAEWAIGIDYIGGTAERIVQGAVVTDITLTWENGTVWTVDMSILYADEAFNESITPTDIQTLGPEKTFNHSATDIDVASVGIQGATTVSLSLSGIARLRDGMGRKPYAAVIGAIEPTLEMQADFTDESPAHLQLAYGDAAEPVDEVGSAPIDIEATNKDGNTLNVAIDAAKPATYGWSDVVDADADEQESITFNLFDDGNAGVTLS